MKSKYVIATECNSPFKAPWLLKKKSSKTFELIAIQINNNWIPSGGIYEVALILEKFEIKELSKAETLVEFL